MELGMCVCVLLYAFFVWLLLQIENVCTWAYVHAKKYFSLYVCMFLGTPRSIWSAGPKSTDRSKRSQRRTGMCYLWILLGYWCIIWTCRVCVVLQGEGTEGKTGPPGPTGDPGDRVWHKLTYTSLHILTLFHHSSYIHTFLFQGPRGPPGEIGTKVKKRTSFFWMFLRYNE